MTTLMLSKAPVMNSMTRDSQKDFDTPKTMVATPKPATATNRARPAFFIGGRWAIAMAMAKAPNAGAARSQPKPVAPTLRISLAKMGSR